MKKDLRVRLEKEQVVLVAKTGITPPLPAEIYTPEKHEVPPTLWQRFKAAIGF
jgi:hypothetical protein